MLARVTTQRVPREIREQQMLDAAVTVFAQRGYRRSSMDDIAEAAGITKPMIYLYIGSKDDLFLAAIDRESRRLIDSVLASADPALPADQQLWHGLAAFLDGVATDRDSWWLVSRRALEESAEFASAGRALRRMMVVAIGGQLKRAADQGPKKVTDDDIHGLAVALVGACEAMADRIADHPEVDSRVAASQLMNLTWMGFGRLLEGKRWHP